MGSIPQFFDLNQRGSSKKMGAHKRQIDGHEAPRNSLEFSVQTSHNYNVIQDDIPYSCQVKQHPSKMSYRSNDAPMKRLVDDEMTRRVITKHNSPNVVARLMGMDSLPSETKLITHAYKWKDEGHKSNLSAKDVTKFSSSHHANSLSSASIMRTKQVPYDIKKESIQSTNSHTLAKPRPREHPQEELLQKFKKDFEAWQTSKLWENSKSSEEANFLRQTKVNQILAQENLNKERMARYWESRKHAACMKPAEQKGRVSLTKSKTIGGDGICLPQDRYMNKQLAISKLGDKHDRSPSPTRIVILRSGMEMSDDAEASWSGSPGLLDQEASMQDFLEEVNERLKSEIQGKMRTSNTTRGFPVENTFGERTGDTNQFARPIAKHIRECVTRDLGTSLVRSESTRSFSSEFQLNGPEFPEFVNQNTRKLLSERLKNVIRNETDVEIPLAVGGRSRRNHERLTSQSMHDFPKSAKESGHLEDKRPPTRSKVISDGQNDASFDAEPTSPRNLVRSVSAPASGTAFAKLLLQDQHVLTWAHIRRKHEASESSSPELRRKKDGFNLKGTVSSLRHNFTLKGKLFGKKARSVDESSPNEVDYSKPLVTSPSMVTKFGTVQDNSTEVPPSPASVSSSSIDEFCRPGVPSPVSPLQGSFIEDRCASKVTMEINSIIPEPINALQHVEHGGFEVAVESYDDVVDGPEQAYIRDILIAAGLYGGEIFGEVFPKWDISKKPIPAWVFDEVEEAYRQTGKSDEASDLYSYGDANTSRKLLFDLTNEALLRVLKLETRYTFKERVLCPNTVQGRKKLLDDLWWQIRVYINTALNRPNSVDGMVAQDVMKDPWCAALHEDLYVTGRKIELVILEDLIDEFMSEMFLPQVHKMRAY